MMIKLSAVSECPPKAKQEKHIRQPIREKMANSMDQGNMRINNFHNFVLTVNSVRYFPQSHNQGRSHTLTLNTTDGDLRLGGGTQTEISKCGRGQMFDGRRNGGEQTATSRRI